jgi:hypothetical protein
MEAQHSQAARCAHDPYMQMSGVGDSDKTDGLRTYQSNSTSPTFLSTYNVMVIAE